MSQFNYEVVDNLMRKQREFGEFIQSLRKGLGKKFQYDAGTTVPTASGETNVYPIIEKKLNEIIALKATLPPEARDILPMMVGEDTRFAQWLEKQERHTLHDTFAKARDEIIAPMATRTVPSDPDLEAIQAFIGAHHQTYIRLQKIMLYLERLQLSSNISKKDKTTLKSDTKELLALSTQLKQLGLERLNTNNPEIFFKGLTMLYGSKKFRDFLQYSHDFTQKIDSITNDIEQIMHRNPKFHWHFPATYGLDDLKFCLGETKKLPGYPESLAALSHVPHCEAARAAFTNQQQMIAGQMEMRQQIATEACHPLDFIINLDTEYPCDSADKTAGRFLRSGKIEEALIHLNPELCQRSQYDAFLIRGLAGVHLGASCVNPQEFSGGELLKLSNKDLLFTILAAISPVKKNTIAGETYEFTPAQKLSAYAQLIQAIDDKRLMISEGTMMDQKRSLAERALYIMVKYDLPQDNSDFQAINKRIESGTGSKAAKAFGKMFTKKHDPKIENKTIQKLFREYPGDPKITLEDLDKRIKSRQYYPELATTLADGAGARMEETVSSPPPLDRGYRAASPDGAPAGAGAGLSHGTSAHSSSTDVRLSPVSTPSTAEEAEPEVESLASTRFFDGTRPDPKKHDYLDDEHLGENNSNKMRK